MVRSPAMAVAGEQIRERVAGILGGSGYQTSLPKPLVPPEPVDLPLGPLELLVRIFFWTAIVVLTVLAVAWLVRRLSRPPRDVVLPPPGSSPSGTGLQVLLARIS